METLATPPRWAVWTLELLYAQPLLEAVAGDLLEEFRERASMGGAARARAWYGRQVLTSAVHAARRRWARGDIGALLLASALGCAAVWAIGEAGRFVLSQVPRKAAPQLPWIYEMLRWVLAALLAALAVYWRRREVSK